MPCISCRPVPTRTLLKPFSTSILRLKLMENSLIFLISARAARNTCLIHLLSSHMSVCLSIYLSQSICLNSVRFPQGSALLSTSPCFWLDFCRAWPYFGPVQLEPSMAQQNVRRSSPRQFKATSMNSEQRNRLFQQIPQFFSSFNTFHRFLCLQNLFLSSFQSSSMPKGI